MGNARRALAIAGALAAVSCQTILGLEDPAGLGDDAAVVDASVSDTDPGIADAAGPVSDTDPGSVPDAASGAVPDAATGAVPDAATGAVPDAASGAVPDAASGAVPDAATAPDAGPPPCDMTGRWVIEEHTSSMALGAVQRSTAWSYVDITQRGDTFTIERGLRCGYVITGTTTVTLPDPTLQALARQDSVGPGRRGRFAPSSDGQRCDFALDRMYHVRGAHRHLYLLDHWRVGDPPRPLTEFPLLPKAPPGMEDWDKDAMDGFTQRTGLGDRYIAQRDWNEHAGTAERFATRFGGEGAVTVRWDGQEAVSDQTPVLLRTVATPRGDGWARYVRADDLDVTGGELAICRLVQARARATWPPSAGAR